MSLRVASSQVYGWFAVLAVGSALAQPVVYEGSQFPDPIGWERLVACEPVRYVDEGWLVQDVEVGCGGPPGGDWDGYRRPLAEFAGSESFYFEWRAITDGDRSQIVGTAPYGFATSDLYGVKYHFTVSRDQVRLIRSNFLPIVFVDVDADLPHTFRLELHGAERYTWYIDGVIVDGGIPRGPYPTPTAQLVWRARAWYQDSTTRWDYIRFGVIPQRGSGDFDGDGAVSLADYYFFHDCLTKSGPGLFGGPDNNAGPGCRFADFDDDGDVDLRDFAAFQRAYTTEK